MQNIYADLFKNRIRQNVLFFELKKSTWLLFVIFILSVYPAVTVDITKKRVHCLRLQILFFWPKLVMMIRKITPDSVLTLKYLHPKYSQVEKRAACRNFQMFSFGHILMSQVFIFKLYLWKIIHQNCQQCKQFLDIKISWISYLGKKIFSQKWKDFK